MASEIGSAAVSLSEWLKRDANNEVNVRRKMLKFLPDAIAAARRSKDRSTRVGAVVVDDDYNMRISGYNGFARGVNDEIDARHERPAKYRWTSHSEENCVAQAARIGVSLRGCTLILTSLFPCTTCSRLIIQSGIKRVIAPEFNMPGKLSEGRVDWDEEAQTAMEMLVEGGVQIWTYTETEYVAARI